MDSEKEIIFNYIEKNIQLCNLEEKTHILTQIISAIGKARVQVTSDGSNIFLDDMSIDLLKKIKYYIDEVNNRNKIDFTEVNNKP